MNIGVDLDGVLFDTENYFRTRSEIYDIESGGAGMIGPEELKIEKRYGWPKEKRMKYLHTFSSEIELTAPLMPYAKEVIEKLKKLGHKLIVISSRGCLGEKEIKITKKRLRKNKIKFDKMFFNIKHKQEVCIAQNIDVMIEDLYDNVQAISDAGITCLYFEDVVRKPINKPNVISVRNWGEIYRQILKLDIQKGNM